MKRFFALLLVCLALCSVLCACGDDEDDTAGVIVGDLAEESDDFYTPEGGSDDDGYELGGVPLG